MNYEENIQQLRTDIEQKLHRTLVSPADFTLLVDAMAKEKCGNISLSTVKRVWGYVSNGHALRNDTLSVFARFLGYDDWTDYCREAEMRQTIDSDFLSAEQIRSSELSENDRIEVRWRPDRRLILRYLGNDEFRVEASENGKLTVGDTFKASIFCKNHPLIVSDLTQTNGNANTYVAGRKNGLTSVRIL